MSVREMAALVRELPSIASTGERTRRLATHFDRSDDASAAWALWFLLGNRRRRSISAATLRSWVAARAGISEELAALCHDHVGDLAETLALLLPDPPVDPPDLPLATLVAEGVEPLAAAGREEQARIVAGFWDRLDRDGSFLYHKVITGAFRIGVAKGLAVRAAAASLGVDVAVLEERLMGGFEPSADAWRSLRLPPDESEALLQPRPFQLAHAVPAGFADEASPAVESASLEEAAFDLGPIDAWLVEWKWDGVRAQLLRRGDPTIASRGEGRLDGSFPEVIEAARALPRGCVLDGEVVLWQSDRPAPFASLQRRLGVSSHIRGLFDEEHAVMFAFDLLELDGADLRALPLRERRSKLEALLGALPAEGAIRISPRQEAATWEAANQLRLAASNRGVEGLMLKRLEAPYAGGRPRGSWWKWKLDPRRIDAVIVAAQSGHGRRAGLLSDYTLALRDGDGFTTIAKAYSGLAESEIRELDRLLRQSIVAKRGPVRVVEPSVVLEIAFEGLRESPRHRSGLALRFPRIARWRRDKSPADADTLASLRAMLRDREVPKPPLGEGRG
ncbi:MAG: ATP-dependent DNA ligase [Phycisphaerales bacterium]